MTSLNISLPRSMRVYIESRVRNGPYSTPSEFIRSLVREDEQRHAVHSRLAGLLDGAISTSDLTETDWTCLQELLLRHFGNRTSPATKSGRPKRAGAIPAQ